MMTEMDKEPRREFQHYIEDQVLVVGPEDEIEQVVGQAQQGKIQRGLEARQGRETDLGRLQWDLQGDGVSWIVLRASCPSYGNVWKDHWRCTYTASSAGSDSQSGVSRGGRQVHQRRGAGAVCAPIPTG